MGDVSFRVRGSYLESCNCEAICPCRMIGGVPGGRSTYGICFGLLTWRIEEGTVGGLDVSGLGVALVCRYDDDEKGSPWTVELHVDARGDDEQRAALEQLFLDGLGGPHTSKLPWIRKARHLVGVRTSEIVVSEAHDRVTVAPGLHVQATQPVEGEVPVACGIPGYEHVGRELYADELAVLGVELHGNCAYQTTFDYASA
jgi:hypothetical protein